MTDKINNVTCWVVIIVGRWPLVVVFFFKNYLRKTQETGTKFDSIYQRQFYNILVTLRKKGTIPVDSMSKFNSRPTHNYFAREVWIAHVRSFILQRQLSLPCHCHTRTLISLKYLMMGNQINFMWIRLWQCRCILHKYRERSKIHRFRIPHWFTRLLNDWFNVCLYIFSAL